MESQINSTSTPEKLQIVLDGKAIILVPDIWPSGRREMHKKYRTPNYSWNIKSKDQTRLRKGINALPLVHTITLTARSNNCAEGATLHVEALISEQKT